MTLPHDASDLSSVAPKSADVPSGRASEQHGSGIAARALNVLDRVSDALVRARGGYDQDGNVMPAEFRGSASRLGTWR
jgi:hypothetical protein